MDDILYFQQTCCISYNNKITLPVLRYFYNIHICSWFNLLLLHLFRNFQAAGFRCIDSMIFSKIPSCEEKSSIADVRMGFEYNPYIISLTSDIILLKFSLHDIYTVQRCILQTCEISVTKLFTIAVNHFSANFTKWSNILKQIRQQFADELLECV